MIFSPYRVLQLFRRPNSIFSDDVPKIAEDVLKFFGSWSQNHMYLRHLWWCLSIWWCSSSHKLVILFVVIAAAVIVLGLGDIVSVVCSIALSKGFKPFMGDLMRTAT